MSVSSTRLQRFVDFHSPSQPLRVRRKYIRSQYARVVDQHHTLDDMQCVAGRNSRVDPVMLVDEARQNRPPGYRPSQRRSASPLKLRTTKIRIVCLRPSRRMVRTLFSRSADHPDCGGVLHHGDGPDAGHQDWQERPRPGQHCADFVLIDFARFTRLRIGVEFGLRRCELDIGWRRETAPVFGLSLPPMCAAGFP